MNKVCAAGTGSFLEEQSRELGVDVKGEFAARRVRRGARRPTSARAAPSSWRRRCVGASGPASRVEEICAGLAYSIVRNYLEKVVGATAARRDDRLPGGRRLERRGRRGVRERPRAARCAVHPYNRISGAIGAALAARDARAMSGATGAEPLPRLPPRPEPVVPVVRVPPLLEPLRGERHRDGAGRVGPGLLRRHLRALHERDRRVGAAASRISPRST